VSAAHGPGPWKVDDHPRRDYPRVTNARGAFVADCDTDADALLIAAAPDLLEALRKAADALAGYRRELNMLAPSSSSQPCDAETTARAAIARATGEAA
jgi:hypothetical protein